MGNTYQSPTASPGCDDPAYILDEEIEKIKRFSLFYECARESHDACAWVMDARRERDAHKGYKRLLWKFSPKFSEVIKRTGGAGLVWLVDCEDFPDKPFNMIRPDVKAAAGDIPFLGKSVKPVAWEEIGLIFLKAPSADDAIKEIKNYSDLLLFSFPPEASNPELVISFKNWLKEKRPEGEFKGKTGRKGSVNNKAIPDSVRQLMAYRLIKAGKTYTEWNSKLPAYESKQNLNKAAQKAQILVQRVVEQPFYDE